MANYAQMRDEDLMVRYQKSLDETAFGELYDRHADRLAMFLRGKTQRSEGIEDLVHEAFLKVVENAEQFQPQRGTFRSWLFQIARRSSIDEFRRNRRVEPVPPESVDLSQAGIQYHDEGSQVAQEQLQKLPAFINEIDGKPWLTPRQQDVWNAVWDNPVQSNVAIGEQLQVSGENVGQIKKGIRHKIEASQTIITQHYLNEGYGQLRLFFL